REAADRLEVIADTYLSPNAPMQLALRTFLGTRYGFRAQVVTRIRENLAELDRGSAKGICQRQSVEGGWNVVLEAVDERHEALSLTVAGQPALVHPGQFYGLQGKRQVVSSLIMAPFRDLEGR